MGETNPLTFSLFLHFFICMIKIMPGKAQPHCHDRGYSNTPSPGPGGLLSSSFTPDSTPTSFSHSPVTSPALYPVTSPTWAGRALRHPRWIRWRRAPGCLPRAAAAPRRRCCHRHRRPCETRLRKHRGPGRGQRWARGRSGAADGHNQGDKESPR